MSAGYNFKQIHSECGWHEEAIQKNIVCGCFYCLSTFPPSEIEEWVDEPEDCPRGPGRTAICPSCGIDAVIPESEHYKLTKELLEAMNKGFF